MMIAEAVAAMELALVQLRSLAARHPELELVRNQVGNYSLGRRVGGRPEFWGYVDVFNEGVVLDGDPE